MNWSECPARKLQRDVKELEDALKDAVNEVESLRRKHADERLAWEERTTTIAWLGLAFLAELKNVVRGDDHRDYYRRRVAEQPELFEIMEEDFRACQK